MSLSTLQICFTLDVHQTIFNIHMYRKDTLLPSLVWWITEFRRKSDSKAQRACVGTEECCTSPCPTCRKRVSCYDLHNLGERPSKPWKSFLSLLSFHSFLRSGPFQEGMLQPEERAPTLRTHLLTHRVLGVPVGETLLQSVPPASNSGRRAC